MPCAVHSVCLVACNAGPAFTLYQRYNNRSHGLRRPGVAVSATGVGEAIMRAGLARRLGGALALQETLLPGATAADVLREGMLLGQPAALPAPPVDCGALALQVALHPASCSAGCKPDPADPDPGSGAGVQPGALARPCSGFWGTAHAARAGKPSDPDPGPGSASGRTCGTPAPSPSHAAASPTHGPAREDLPCHDRAQRGDCGRAHQGPASGDQGCEVEVELVAVHSARSLGAAWLAPGMHAPRFTFLRQKRLPDACAADAPICSFGVRVRWPLPAEHS